MKKVLIICNYKKGVGGISGQVELLEKYLNREDDYKAEVFSLNKNVCVKVIWFFTLLQRVRKFDILHIHACSHWGFLPAIYGVIVGKVIKKRIVITYHGGGAEKFFEKNIGMVRYFLNKADVVITLSGFLKSIFDKYSISNVVIPNILEFQEHDFPQRKDISPNFISIRSLREIYNIKCIIKAFEIVKKQFLQATLTILGDGVCRKELEAYVRDNNIQDINFIGAVPNNEVYNYMDKADVFLSAPLIDNMPVSVLEAYNAGLLVVSSNVGGVPYILEDNVTGYLFESDNEKELAEKMMLGVNNQEQSLYIIKSAKKEVEKYSWKSVREKILGCYDKS